MDLATFTHPKEYAFTVRSFLEKDEAENGLLLGNLAMHPTNPALTALFMASAKENSQVVFAAYFREINLIITRGPVAAIEATSEKMREANIKIPGVVGPSKESEAMATAWAKIGGCTSFLAMDQLVYKLTHVEMPSGIEGRIRPMNSNDLENVTNWVYGFYKEGLPFENYTLELARQNAEKRLPLGMTFIWEIDGKPVSMAALGRPTNKGVTVNAVYTPTDQRRKGYATALVAAVSAEGLSRGKEFCVLYTDLTNPTSNSIYKRIGYKPICDSRNYRFRYSE